MKSLAGIQAEHSAKPLNADLSHGLGWGFRECAALQVAVSSRITKCPMRKVRPFGYGMSALRRCRSSAASANNQFRNIVILGSIDVALGQTIQ